MLNEHDCKRLISRIRSPERRAKYEVRLQEMKAVKAIYLPTQDEISLGKAFTS